MSNFVERVGAAVEAAAVWTWRSKPVQWVRFKWLSAAPEKREVYAMRIVTALAAVVLLCDLFWWRR